MNKPIKYQCPKCGAKSCTTGKIRTTGGFITSLLNIQYRHFTSVICTECKYTELYNLPLKEMSDLLNIHKEI